MLHEDEDNLKVCREIANVVYHTTGDKIELHFDSTMSAYLKILKAFYKLESDKVEQTEKFNKKLKDLGLLEEFKE